MDNIVNNIVNALYDYDTFSSIIETNHSKGFIRVKDLKSGKEYKITIEETEKQGRLKG